MQNPDRKTPNKSPAVRMGRSDGYFTLETYLFLPHPLDVVFPFFADARNLEAITPPWLHFEYLTALPVAMHAGTVIEYHLRIHGIAVRWQTEITVWDPPLRFVDEQRRGPYRKWVHEHTFKECDDGSEMRDCVRYLVPGGWLVHSLIVKRDVRRIFEYRARRLNGLLAAR